MKPRHTAEQSTVAVNKADKIGKKGFAGLMSTISEPVEEQRVAVEVAATPLEVNEVAPAEMPMAQAKQPTGFSQVSGMNPAIMSQPIATQAVAMNPIVTATHNHTNPPNTNGTSVGAASMKKRPVILPPSDPSEDTVCDSCQ
jgi:hypothetical protein